MSMKWVGILNIKDNYFFLNGRLIAQSTSSFLNFCLFFKLPRFLIIFFKKKPSTHFLNEIKLNLNAQNHLMYYRFRRFIYIVLNSKQYMISVLFGVFISLIIALWMLNSANQYNQRIMTIHSEKNIEKVMDWAKRQCLDNACVKRLSIFPNQLFFIEFIQAKKNLNGCKPIGERGMMCKKESLFMVP